MTKQYTRCKTHTCTIQNIDVLYRELIIGKGIIIINWNNQKMDVTVNDLKGEALEYGWYTILVKDSFIGVLARGIH